MLSFISTPVVKSGKGAALASTIKYYGGTLILIRKHEIMQKNGRRKDTTLSIVLFVVEDSRFN